MILVHICSVVKPFPLSSGNLDFSTSFSIFFLLGLLRPYIFLKHRVKGGYSAYGPLYFFQAIPQTWPIKFWLDFLVECNHSCAHTHTPRTVWCLANFYLLPWPASFWGLWDQMIHTFFSPLPTNTYAIIPESDQIHFIRKCLKLEYMWLHLRLKRRNNFIS